MLIGENQRDRFIDLYVEDIKGSEFVLPVASRMEILNIMEGKSNNYNDLIPAADMINRLKNAIKSTHSNSKDSMGGYSIDVNNNTSHILTYFIILAVIAFLTGIFVLYRRYHTTAR